MDQRERAFLTDSHWRHVCDCVCVCVCVDNVGFVFCHFHWILFLFLFYSAFVQVFSRYLSDQPALLYGHSWAAHTHFHPFYIASFVWIAINKPYGVCVPCAYVCAYVCAYGWCNAYKFDKLSLPHWI